MQHSTPCVVRQLSEELVPLRGLWRETASDLYGMGFSTLDCLRGQDAQSLADVYCRLTKRPVDPVLGSYFASIVRFAETGIAIPWWRFLRDELIREQEQAVSRPVAIHDRRRLTQLD